ncbi:SDR family NAD(P)-dependent oxidoreductase, partial [Streptomyces sp. NPDC059092]|uniref:SDR family NAD(P)-dependent oxidoreductase n=1 Tax=Streptomyces sp. NPDC059092 TaxID=3346725 RepID=UPI0036C6E40C
PRRAAVSAFGISGTNAHTILEQAPPTPDTPTEHPESATRPLDPDGGTRAAPGQVPLVLSARSRPALRAVAGRLAAHLRQGDADLADYAASLLSTRETAVHRSVVVAADRSEAAGLLDALAADAPSGGAVSGEAAEGRLALLFTGQGAQRVGMGGALYAAFPVYATAFDEVCAAFDGLLPTALSTAVLDGDGDGLERTDLAQPALFALEVALFRLLRSWGVAPDFLVGHSIGELAAAQVAGVWSLADACTVVAARGRLMQALPAGGSMAALGVPEADALAALAGHPEVAVAAVNSPHSVVVSGGRDAVAALVAEMAERGARTTTLAVSHAFHSPLMDPVLDEFRAVLADVTFHRPDIPLISTLTGRIAGDELLTAGYWADQLRGAVRFADAIGTARAREVTTFLEVGPDAVLTAMARETLADDAAAACASALRRTGDEARSLLTALGTLHTRGIPVRWERLVRPGARVSLPTYPFQHRRYWPAPGSTADPVALGLRATGHPLLQARVHAAETEDELFTGVVSVATHPWLADHRVLGTVLFPGTGFADLALWAGARVGRPRVEELTLHAPFALSETGRHRLQVVVGQPDGSDRRPVTVHSSPVADADDGEGDGPVWTRHAAGFLAPGVARPAASWSESWPPAAEAADLSGFYDRLVPAGFDYGPAFRCLTRAWRRDDEFFADVRLPEGVASGFAAHPALLDAALHAIALSWDGDGDGDGEPARLPFTWEDVQVHAPDARALRARLVRQAPDRFTLEAVDAIGLPVVTVGSLVMRPADPGRLRTVDTRRGDAFFRVEWTPLDRVAGPPATGAAEVALAVLGTDQGVVPPDAGHSAHPDLASFRAALLRGEDAPAAVLAICPAPWESGPVSSDDTDPAAPRGPADLAAAAHDAAGWALELLRDWLADEPPADVPLVVLTGATPAHATVTGLVRAARAEHPGRVLLVRVEDTAPGDLTAVLPAVLAAGEPETAVRAGVAHVPRLMRADTGLATPDSPWRLDVPVRGSLAGLAAVPADAALEPLRDGQIRIAVRAAGVNFRDVLMALDMYPGEATPGSEGAGVVLETGPGVDGVAPGDRVMGMFDGAFGPVAVADHRTVVPMPDGWSFERAAAVPIAFLTAYHGLVDLAGLRRGRRVLIHAAAGGVGSAAVSLARHLGAEVFGTASPAKWDALRAAGLAGDHIASSRTVEFERAVLDATEGLGVDVVLNALAGEHLDASLRTMPCGGWFLEMGKTDPRDPERVAADHPGVRYRPYDLGEASPERVGQMLSEIVGLLEEGALTPPSLTTFDVRHAPDAFRALSQASITGKAVLTFGPFFDRDETVLVTGGTGTLGARLARHLVRRHGLRHVTLVGRRAAASPALDRLRDDLAGQGAGLTVRACDVADGAAVARLLDETAAGHRLAGVVHAAGVVDDGVLASLTPESLRDVLRPKVDGAWHLHRLTRGMDLRMFALFSSASGTFGSAGQANYAAANVFLDALAEYRAARGLPATSLAWGLWAEDSGMTSGLTDRDRRRLVRAGVAPLDTEEGLALFDDGVAAGLPTVVTARLDLPALRREHRHTPPPPLLRALVHTGPAGPGADTAADDGAGTAAADVAARLRALGDDDRDRALLDLVRTEVAAVLGHASAEEVDADHAFKDQGFDSLTAVELRNRLRDRTAVAVPTTLVFDHPTPVALARHLSTLLAPVRLTPAERILRELDRLEPDVESVPPTDDAYDEIHERLRRILARLRTADVPRPEAAGLDDADVDEVVAFIESEFGDFDGDPA